MANSLEEPKYTIVESYDEIEIRYYPPTIQARTPLSSNDESAKGFKTLAGFIFGGNANESSIAMTAPVQEDLYTQNPTMAFTMPSEYSMDSLPQPNNSNVEIVSVPARTMAVIPFSGWATDRKIKSYTRQLKQQLEIVNISVINNPMLNQYNPPWTPPFLRRNEIMIEILWLEPSVRNINQHTNDKPLAYSM